MAKSQTDNEWAADFVGLNNCGAGYVWPESDNQCIQDYWKQGTNHCDYCTWQPDKDLNQFKLVLDAYTQWWLSPDSAPPVKKTQFFPVNIRSGAWYGPAEELKRIREAVEGD